MFTTLISDFGCVLTYPQDEHWVRKMIELLNVSVSLPEFQQIYTDFRVDYDAGLIDYHEYWHKIAGTLHGSLTPEKLTTLIDYDFKSWFNINQEMLSFLKSVKGSFARLVLLSNINYECVAFLEKTCTWLELFDIKVYSCVEKCAKPDKVIYQTTLARAGVTPQECIFIDDNPHNIKASRELGINGLLFTSVADIKTQFQDLKLI